MAVGSKLHRSHVRWWSCWHVACKWRLSLSVNANSIQWSGQGSSIFTCSLQLISRYTLLAWNFFEFLILIHSMWLEIGHNLWQRIICSCTICCNVIKAFQVGSLWCRTRLYDVVYCRAGKWLITRFFAKGGICVYQCWVANSSDNLWNFNDLTTDQLHIFSTKWTHL